MATRPKYGPKRDKNDKIIKEALSEVKHEIAGFKITVRDTSKVGHFIDRLVYLGPLCIAVEVKDEMNGEKRLRMMTTGEREFPGIKFVVCTPLELIECLVQCTPLAATLLLQMVQFVEEDDLQIFCEKYLTSDSPFRAMILNKKTKVAI